MWTYDSITFNMFLWLSCTIKITTVLKPFVVLGCYPCLEIANTRVPNYCLPIERTLTQLFFWFAKFEPINEIIFA